MTRIALRGHRDDRTVANEDPDHNHGNFWVLLNFRVSASDSILEQHLKNTPGNASYTSKTVQNQLISLCGDFIRDTILKQVREASAFSVIADEATDVANQKQLSISNRYVHHDVLYERFLGFLMCETGVTGEVLAENILTQLTSLQICYVCRVMMVLGQCLGRLKVSLLTSIPNTPRHCALCTNFNYSPKRQLCLEKWITDTLPTEEKRRKLKELCKTRWIERYDSYEVFIDLFVPIACCLEDIANLSNAEWNGETRSEALSFLLALSQFSLIFTLMMVHTILASTRGLSIKLQARYMDIVCAHSDMDMVKSALKGYRSRIPSPCVRKSTYTSSKY